MSTWMVSTGYVDAFLTSSVSLDRSSVAGASLDLPGGFSLAGTDSQPEHHCGNRIDIAPADRADLIVDTTDPLSAALMVADDHSIRNLPFVIYTLLERARQERQMCTLHAAGVSRVSGEQGVLLLGDKGAGKSLTVEALCTMDYLSCGDDLLILEMGEFLDIRSGNRRCFLRSSNGAGGIPYEAKTEVVLAEAKFMATSVQVHAVIRLRVHPENQPSLVRATTPSLREALRLHENLARYIRGVTTPLAIRAGIPEGCVPSLDTPELAVFRSAVIKTLFSLPFFYVSSRTPDEACSLIDQAVSTL